MSIFVLLIGVVIISIIFIYNTVVSLRNNVDKAKSAIDVYLQQRFDLIPNLIEITKKYMNYEKDIFERIAKLRNLYNQTRDIQACNELNNQYKTIMVLVENFPELKSSEQFLQLQKTLIKIESQLQASRRIYNNDVTKYNTKIATFPSNLVAGIFNFQNKELFVLDGEDKGDV